MAITKKNICPECGKAFTTRKLANQHMVEEKHKGAVIVEFIEPTPTKKGVKTTPILGTLQTRALSEKEQRMQKAWELYTAFVEKGDGDKTAVSKVSKELKEKEGKIKGWVGTMRGRSRKKSSKVLPAAKIKEPEPEPEPEREIKMWCRIADKDWKLIKTELPEGVIYTSNPENGNHIIQYTTFNQRAFDYLLFKYDFVEIEMENSDLLFILPQIDLNELIFVKDIASLEFMSVGDVSDKGCLQISPEWEMLNNSQIIGRLSSLPPRNLACAGGVWDKMVAAKPTTTVTTTTPAKKTTTTGTISAGDYDAYWFASEERGYGGGYGHHILGGRTYSKSTTTYKPKPKPKIPTYHPIYKISEEYIFIDRLVDYTIYMSEEGLNS